MPYNIAVISLGCAKNLVNTEQMLHLLTQAGHSIVPDPDGADAVLINTCGFIDAAKSEAIDNILQMAELKAGGRLGKIIVSGCLSERYQGDILSELPEIDAVLGVGSFDEIVPALDDCMAGRGSRRFADKDAPLSETPRVVTTGPAWAYIKIAEGCANRCAFCAIPGIRGKLRSRPMENVLAEARELCAAGVRELIIVAQDPTQYGADIYGRRSLAPLLRELCRLDFTWIRVHYMYPDGFTPELIDVLAGEEKIVKYLDIPIQHVNDAILRRMRRRGTKAEITELFRTLRERMPGCVLRTSLITGLPGEGAAEFEELCEFLRETRIERVGVFAFSPEEGTEAADMTDRCDEAEAQRRAELIMELQSGVMDGYNASMLGRTLDVICEGVDGETGLMCGRSFADSPDVDGRVYFSGSCAPGDFAPVLITGAAPDGGLTGEIISRGGSL